METVLKQNKNCFKKVGRADLAETFQNMRNELVKLPNED